VVLKLNNFQRALSKRNLDTDVDSGLSSLHRMVIESLKEDIFSKTGDLRGFVLRVEGMLEKPPSKSFIADQFDSEESKNYSYIFGVKVRIPELHSYLPNPMRVISNKAEDPEFDVKKIDRLIDMHPTFICRDYKLANDLPTIGDIVYVDFVDKTNWREGIYKGKVFEQSPGINLFKFGAAVDRYFDRVGTPSCIPPSQGDAKGAKPNVNNHIPEFCEPVPLDIPGEDCKTDPTCGWHKGKPIKGFTSRLVGSGNRRMLPETKGAFDRLNEIAIREGLAVFGITVAFRTYADQQSLVDRHTAGDPKVYTPSKPGRSNHHAGTAIDVKLAAKSSDMRQKQMNFLKKYASKAGFIWAGEKDPVHIELSNTASVVQRIKADLGKDLQSQELIH
jgi:hypothetical protein